MSKKIYNNKLVSELSRYIGKKRVAHSIEVARTADRICRLYAPGRLRQAETAALLHDNAKKLRSDEFIEYAARFDIELTDYELQEPHLLHGKIGAALLPERFGVDDPEVMQAICDHVTGNAEMDELGKILFVADQAAGDRDFPGVGELREAIDNGLDFAVWMTARFKLSFIISNRRLVVPDTVAVYNRFHPDVVSGNHSV